MPKISVIMSVYNGAKFLEETLESVINQTFRDFELIIIDNCSTDDTALIAKKYANQYKNIIYQHHNIETKFSFPAGINKGFSLAKGEYWTKLDADDLYYPNALERMNYELDTHPGVDFVYCDMELMDGSGKIKRYSKVRPAEELIFYNCIGNCMLFRSTLAKKVGNLSENNEKKVFVEDYDYWLRCNEAGILKPINECLFRYRTHSGNVSTHHEKEMISKSILLQKARYSQYINSRRKAALFYAYIRSRDIFNPVRQFYLLLILFYSPSVFFQVAWNRIIPEL